MKAKRIRGSTGAMKRDKKQQITNLDTQMAAIGEEIQLEEDEIYECDQMLHNGEVTTQTANTSRGPSYPRPC